MKEGIIKCIAALFFAIAIIGCTEKNNEETKITQRIMGAGDCIENNGWSWSNGEAYAMEEHSSFSFVTKVSGELSFSYICNQTSTLKPSYLKIVIENKQYFYKTGTSSSHQQSSLGNVKAGETIVFTGTEYKVRGIQIVGDATNQNSDNPSNPNNPWDF